jgi:MFS family permease
VALLFLVGVFNFMDRQVLSILIDPIKASLNASDSAMGLLTGFAFVSFFTIASLPIARLADVYSRSRIIAIGLAFWSVMTALSGFVGSFFQLALARGGVGIVEAASAPAGHSIISDLFPGSPRKRRVILQPTALLSKPARMNADINPIGVLTVNQSLTWELGTRNSKPGTWNSKLGTMNLKLERFLYEALGFTED